MSRFPELRLSESDEEHNETENVQKDQIISRSSSSYSSDSSDSSNESSSDVRGGNLKVCEQEMGGTLNKDAERNVYGADASIEKQSCDKSSQLQKEIQEVILEEKVEDKVDVVRVNQLGGFSENAVSMSVNCPGHSKAWSQSVVLKPYKGELMPKGLLHCGLSFSSYYAKLFEQPPATQASKLIDMFTPKFEELKKSRRFNADNLQTCADSLIAKSSTSELHQNYFYDKENIMKVAVKSFTDYKSAVDIVKEVHTLLYLQHTGITQLLGAFHDVQTHLVMPLMQGVLKPNIPFLLPVQKVKFIVQLLQAVSFIHEKEILHLDITPSNVFITPKNNAVLGNFGYSQILPKGVQYVRAKTGEPTIGRPSYNDAFANSGVYSKASDIFGLGCTIYEMDINKPLMEYTSWDAPVEEYIRVATLGKLRRFPPTRDGHRFSYNNIENLDGDREPLIERVNESMFASFLRNMVKHSLTKPTAAEILQSQKAFFSKLLRERGTDLDDLKNHLECAFVQLFPERSKPSVNPNLSSQLNFALDAIYFDSNLAKDLERSNAIDGAKEFRDRAVSVNLLKTAIEELIENKGRDVRSSGNTANLTLSTRKLEASAADAFTVATSCTMSSETLRGELNCNVPVSTQEFKNSKLCYVPSNMAKENVEFTPKQPSKEFQLRPVMPSLPTSSSAISALNFKKLVAETPSHGPSARSGSQTSSGKSTNSEAVPAALKVLTSGGVSIPIRNGESTKDVGSARNKSAWKADSTGGSQNPGEKRKFQHDATNSHKEQRFSEDNKDGKKLKISVAPKNKEIESSDEGDVTDDESDPDLWVFKGTGDVPAEERGRPAPFVNVPVHIRKTLKLTKNTRGFFDCHVCKHFFTVDYNEWEAHVSKCVGTSKQKTYFH